MKKIISFISSFALGFFFFIAGGAVASETIDQAPEVEQVVVIEETVDEPAQSSDPVENLPAETKDVYCFEIGHSVQSSDCFCVHEYVSSMAEADCLLASGIVTAADYEVYRQMLGAGSED
jgi:hypothetical protein